MSHQPSAWMESLVAVVSDCIEAHSAMGPLGFGYREEEEFGELIVYPTPVELRGGTTDGTVVLPGFSLDLQALGAAFEQVVAVHWCAHGFGTQDLEGAHISIEGIYQGITSGCECWLSLQRMKNRDCNSTRQHKAERPNSSTQWTRSTVPQSSGTSLTQRLFPDGKKEQAAPRHLADLD